MLYYNYDYIIVFNLVLSLTICLLCFNCLAGFLQYDQDFSKTFPEELFTAPPIFAGT